MKLITFILIILCSNVIFAQSMQDSSSINLLYELQHNEDDLVVARISYHSEIKCQSCLKSFFSSEENTTFFLKTEKINKLSNFQHTQIISSLKKIKNKKMILIKDDCITPYEERQALYILYQKTLYSFVYVPCQGVDFGEMLKENKELVNYLQILLVL